jgi:hypothetical protein
VPKLIKDILYLPPICVSILCTLQTKPLGGSQEAIASASVNALNTLSTGAVKTL